MSEELQDKTNQQPEKPEEGKEINLLELVYKLWSQRRVIFVWCLWGVIAGLIIAFSIPREYDTKVKLAPEFRNNRSSLAIGALASMAGLSTNSNSTTDAVYPTLYPDIIGSIPFLTSLFDVPVQDMKGNKYTVKDYLLEETKAPWWSAVLGLPKQVLKVIGGGKKDNDEILIFGNDSTGGNPNFMLSKTDDLLVKVLRGRIQANMDQKTYVITINTEMQDPLVSAILADTVVSRLRDYVTEYRTNKARQDLEYVLKLNKEAQESYYQAQQALADYTDRNQNLATRSAQVTRDRLSNEASLAFNLYNETALKVQNAQAKVQETMPVYMELVPATVPNKPASPRKGLILAGFVFLAFCGGSAWVLFGKPMVGEYKEKVKELKASDPNTGKHQKPLFRNIFKRKKDSGE